VEKLVRNNLKVLLVLLCLVLLITAFAGCSKKPKVFLGAGHGILTSSADEKYRYQGLDKMDTDAIAAFKQHSRKKAEESKQMYKIEVITDTRVYSFETPYNDKTQKAEACIFTVDSEELKDYIEEEDIEIELSIKDKDGLWDEIEVNGKLIPSFFSN